MGIFAGRTYQHAKGSPENLKLMRLLDQQYTRTPFYGVRRMTFWLAKQGYGVNSGCGDCYDRWGWKRYIRNPG